MTLSDIQEQIARNKAAVERLTSQERDAYQRELDAVLARSGAETWREVQ